MEAQPHIGSVIGGYRIEGIAGRGGMGVVYKATQLTLERTVALKLLAPELADDDAFRQRFKRESRLLAAIDHPNVITVHEAGEQEGRLFIAMRFVVGTDLRARLKDEGRFAPRRAADLIGQVAAALDAAHARGLIHRDVKPANVLIEDREGHDHAFLTDFGLTKAVGSTSGGLTATGQFVGTVDYVAPEQVMGRATDARADVYSLGCMLYTALAGRVPFERDSDVAKIFAHVNDSAPPLHAHATGLPPALESVVTRAMEKEPDDRYQSAGDLARAATAAVAGTEPAVPERSVATGQAAPAPLQDRPSTSPPPAADPTVVAAAATTQRAATHPGRGPGRRRRLPRTVLALVGVIVSVAAIVIVAGGGAEDEHDGLTATLTQTSIAAGDTPERIAVGEGASWASDRGGGTVTRIDSPTGQPGDPIRVGDKPGAIAVADGMVLVIVDDGGAAIARIDAEKRKLAGPPVKGEYSLDADLAASGGDVWTILSTGEAGQVDPRSGRLLATVPVPSPGADGRVAVGGGAVWVTASQEDRSFIVRIDSESQKVVAKRDLGAGSFAAGLAFGEGALWVAEVGHNLILRVHPDTNRVTTLAKANVTGVSTDDIAAGDGAVWVANADPNRLLRFNPGNGDLTKPLTPIAVSENSELAVGLGAAWLTEPDRDAVHRFAY